MPSPSDRPGQESHESAHLCRGESAAEAASGAEWTVGRPSLSRLADLAPLALGSSSEDRCKIVLSVLADLLRRSAADDLHLAELAENGAPVAVAIAVRTAPDAASLLAVDAVPASGLPTAAENPVGGACRGTPDGGSSDERSPAGIQSNRQCAAIQHLLRYLHQQLADAGVRFVQAMREPNVEQPTLLACGYEFLATLDYLVAGSRPRRRHRPGPAVAPAAAPAAEELRSVDYREFYGDRSSLSPHDALVALVDATYVGSLDCPRMERFRSAAAMLGTYQRSSAHDPQAWQVLLDAEDEVVGCLLATAHPGAGSLEITYMGLVPAARGRGYAAGILEYAWQLADARGLSQLTLAVDRANEPAVKLYRRHGFEVLISESVWARGIAVEREIEVATEIREEQKMREW